MAQARPMRFASKGLLIVLPALKYSAVTAISSQIIVSSLLTISRSVLRPPEFGYGMGMEDDSVDAASNARRERLRALRAAKDLMSSEEDTNPPPAGVAAEDSEERRNVSGEEDSIEQATSARRERLKALRAAKELLSTPDEASLQNENQDEASQETEEEKDLNMKFRNYLPHDKQLQEGKLAPAVLPKFEDPVAPASPSEKIEDPFVNIAPKKPNWDLRRDIQKKLDKLERRTQKALYQLAQQQEKERETTGEENGAVD